MLTKNFYNYMLMKMTKRTISTAFTDLNGTVCNAVYTTSTSSDRMLDVLYYMTTSATSYGARIGTGATPATADDYKLESMITSGVSISYPSETTVSKDNDGVSFFASYAITNTGKTALAISEIGLIGNLYYGTSSTSQCPALLERTVLESPITINPGEAKTLTYTIRFNYPT